MLAMRCAGYNNIDLKEAAGKIRVLRVPAYSPHAVAEHAMGLLLTLNREDPQGLHPHPGFQFQFKRPDRDGSPRENCGHCGNGKDRGQCFASICEGFGMRVLAYDPYPNTSLGAGLCASGGSSAAVGRDFPSLSADKG